MRVSRPEEWMTKVFVSYSHKQGTWVWERLMPVLRAGETEVLIDRERFKAGVAVVGQMDKIQGTADVHVLCLSADYLVSDACCHEIECAIACDPRFTKAINPRVKRGLVVPVRLDDTPLPAAIAGPNPLWVDMREDPDPEPWRLLLDRCQVDLGMSAPAWLAARNDIVRFLKRRQSVNLLVTRDGVRWRELIEHLKNERFAHLACVDFQEPSTIPREGLLNSILSRLGARERVRHRPNDLADFTRILSTYAAPVHIVIGHFDLAPQRKGYGADFFSAFRWLTMETRKVVLLIQSRTPFAALLPRNNPLSAINIETVTLD